MDQHAGHCPAAQAFLEQNEVQPKICLHCKRPLPYKRKQVDTFFGMFDEEYPLWQRELKDGRTADEFLQAAPWSSGPVHFLGLQVSDGTVFEWTEEEMEEWL
jgi:hypothetical protein